MRIEAGVPRILGVGERKRDIGEREMWKVEEGAKCDGVVLGED
jgi:hypothetical protein